LAVVGAVVALVGGLFWCVKAVALMIMGLQPPVIYEIAPLFFPIAVAGLSALVEGPTSRLRRAGLACAGLAELAAVVSVVGLYFGPADWTPTGESATVLTPFITLSAFGTFTGLLLVGIAIRRAVALPGLWRNLPMFLALTAVPVIGSGAILEAINQRLFELPTLVIGVEWIALGAVMARRAEWNPAEWVRGA
jgi:hypothetical protein